MPNCFVIMKRKCRKNQIVDENSVNRINGNGNMGNMGYSGANLGGLWFFMKAPLSAILACFINNDSQASSMRGEEEEAGRVELYGDNRRQQQLWFANDLDIAERNYLAVQSSMRYAIQM